MLNKILFFGDVLLSKAYVVDYKIKNDFIFNMEFPITTSDVRYGNKIHLKSTGNFIQDTFGKKPIAVCLSNNHIIDYGEEGFLDTIKELERSNIRYFGAGYLSDNCNNPILLESEAGLVALLGYCCQSSDPIYAHDARPGVLPINSGKIAEDIVAARSRGAARVIIFLHWGAEDVYFPKPQDVNIARAAIDAGCDLVIGHHSHCIQPYEIYNRKHIFYGLGNCIMPDLNVPAYHREDDRITNRFIKKQQTWNRYSLAVGYSLLSEDIETEKLHFNGKALSLTPCNINNYQLTLKSLDNYEKIFKISFFFNKIISKIINLFKKPKIPNIHAVKMVINAIKDKNYS